MAKNKKENFKGDDDTLNLWVVDVCSALTVQGTLWNCSEYGGPDVTKGRQWEAHNSLQTLGVSLAMAGMDLASNRIWLT